MKTSRVVYFCLLVLSFCLLIFVPNRTSAVFFYSLIILPIISLLFCLPGYFGLKVEQYLEKPTIVKGGKAEFDIGFTSSVPFSVAYLKPIFVSGSPTASREELFLTVPIFGRKSRLKYKITYRHCGSYEAGMSYVRITDFLGLWSFKKTVSQLIPIAVLPRIYSLSYLPLDSLRQSDNAIPRNTKSSDSLLVSGVREYEKGDSFKHIHWKLSSKKNELLVKEYEEQVRRSVSLEIDTGGLSQGTDLADKLLEAAIGALDYAVRNDFLISVKIGGDEFFNVENPRDFEEAHRKLGLFERLGSTDGYFSDAASSAESSVLITSRLSNEQKKSLKGRASRGERLVLIFVYDELTQKDAELFDRYKECDIYMYSLSADAEKLRLTGIEPITPAKR